MSRSTVRPSTAKATSSARPDSAAWKRSTSGMSRLFGWSVGSEPIHSPGLVTDRIGPDDSSAPRSEYCLSIGIFGDLVTSPADAQLLAGCRWYAVTPALAAGAAAVPSSR
jgi:hypothetical protein